MQRFKQILMGCVLILGASIAQAHDLSPQMQQKLVGNGKAYDFRFNQSFNVSTIKVILEQETKIQLEIAPQVNQNKQVSFNFKGLTYLEFLKKGAELLHLKAVEVSPNKILLIPQH